MLHSLNDIASAKNTKECADAVKYFLNYAASNPDAEIIYRMSDMILQLDSDAAYLVCPEARSRAGGYFFLGNKDRKLFNGALMVLAKIIKNVMASAAESEVAGLYMNAREAVPMRQALIEMGHPQPATPMKTDNSTATGILNNTIKQKRSKAIDMRFYWLRDRVQQGMFDVYWEPGLNNLADYPTKHHSGKHHRKLRSIYLSEKDSPTTVQGCIELLNYKKLERAATATTSGPATTATALHMYDSIDPQTISRYSITKACYSVTNSKNNCDKTQYTNTKARSTKSSLQSLRQSLSLIMNNSLLTQITNH
jgi:hypothetical protein